MSTPGQPPDFEQEAARISAGETALAMLGFEHSATLSGEDFAAVIGGSLDTLVSTLYYYAEEERAIITQVYNSLQDTTPKLSVRVGKVYEDDPTVRVDEAKKPTGAIEFSYSVRLDTPWDLSDSPERGLGGKIVLNGTGFQMNTGSVIVNPDGAARYQRADFDSDRFYPVAGPDGEEVAHPDPVSLFPSFTATQESELERMALDLTDTYLQTFGFDIDVLWEHTGGLRWDVHSPGTRDMWRDIDNRLGPLHDPQLDPEADS